MIKCSALTKQEVLCKHECKSGCTYQGPDGWTYYLCGQHHAMIQADVHSVTLEKNIARGHKPDQVQLDINNPIATAWVTKEKPVLNTVPWLDLAKVLDYDHINDVANTVYDTDYRDGQIRMVTENSGQAGDTSQPGWLYCGSDYIASISRDQDKICFNRAHNQEYQYDIDEFINKEVPTIKAFNEKGKEEMITQAEYYRREQEGLAAAETYAYGDDGPDYADDEHDGLDPEYEALIAEQQNTPQYVMVTGHRAKEFNDTETANIIPLLTRVLEKLSITRNVVAITGGADGADRMFARAAHNLDIPFDLYLPHPGYYAKHHRNAPWTTKIQEAAQNVVFSKENGPFHYSMNFVRNIDMIKAAEVHVVVSNKSISDLLRANRGGTSHAVKSMRALGVERIIHVNPARNTVSWVNLNGGE